MTEPAETPTAIPLAPPAHEGYAGGSTTFDAATWTRAVERLLAAVSHREVKSADGKTVATVREHETDPPEHGRWTRRSPKPGPLPVLVLESEIARGAKTREHTNTAALGASLDLDLYHAAKFVVGECRRQHARGLSLRAPVAAGEGVVELTFVMVL